MYIPRAPYRIKTLENMDKWVSLFFFFVVDPVEHATDH